MTRHCATCNCADDEWTPQPSTSTPAVRKQAITDTAAAVKAAKEKRGAEYGGQR